MSVSGQQLQLKHADPVDFLQSSFLMRYAAGNAALGPKNSPIAKVSFSPTPLPHDKADTWPTDRATQGTHTTDTFDRAIGNEATQGGPAAAVGSTKANSESATDSSSKGRAQKDDKSGPRSGVIHLDSTSLGRWTVEHLARNLSRQPTGMTGIDPRISAPRSRLSPF